MSVSVISDLRKMLKEMKHVPIIIAANPDLSNRMRVGLSRKISRRTLKIFNTCKLRQLSNASLPVLQCFMVRHAFKSRNNLSILMSRI